MRPNKQRSNATIIFLITVFVISLVAIVSSLMQLNLLTNAQNGITISTEEANLNDMRELVIALLAILLNIGSMITFIMWFRRGYYNLHTLNLNLKYSEGWAAGAWFVPFLNLARPVQIMSEMSNRSHELLTDAKLISKKNKLMTIIPIWWTIWILMMISGNIAARSMDSDTINGLISGTWVNLIDNIFNVIGAVIAVLLVREYAKMEELLPLLNSEGTALPLHSNNDLLDQ